MSDPVPSIDLIWQSAVPKEYFDAAERALRRAIAHVGMADRLPVAVIGVHPDVERILAAARLASDCVGKPGQALSDVVGLWLASKRWRPKGWNGLGMLIVNDDYGYLEDEFIFGQADAGVGGTVSTFRFMRDDRVAEPVALFETLVIHELGHAIGAADPERGRDIQLWFGPHCMNPCAMRQRDDLPEFAEDVLPYVRAVAPYCTECVRDARKFLAGHLAE